MEPSGTFLRAAILGTVLTIAGVMLLTFGRASTLFVCLGAALVIAGVLVLSMGVLRREVGESSAPARRAPASTVKGSRPDASRLFHGADSLAPAIGEMTVQFNDWLDQLDGIEDPWAPFDRWIRDALNQFVSAGRVRCFRLPDDKSEPVSLTDNSDDAFWYGAVPHGLLNHVIQTGQRYLQGYERQDEHLARYAEEWNAQVRRSDKLVVNQLPEAILPIRRKNVTIGLIVLGKLPESQRMDLAMLRAVEQLLGQFWRYVDQYDALQLALRIDRTSGVLNRLDLTQMSERVLKEADADAEPAVILAIVVEGVRWLDDHGRWALRDWLMKQIGKTMRDKLRSDDLVGRFSDDRFVAVLRRLNVSLGRMIAGNLMKSLEDVIHTTSKECPAIQLRCGLTLARGADFTTSLSSAFQAVQESRKAGEQIRVIGEETPRVTQVATEQS